jgi:hypothetical protein
VTSGRSTGGEEASARRTAVATSTITRSLLPSFDGCSGAWRPTWPIAASLASAVSVSVMSTP